jgi:hypothetical protein
MNTYFSYRELNGGKPATEEEFREQLSKYPRNSLIQICAVMNRLIRPATYADTEVQPEKIHERMVRQFFEPQFAEELISAKRPVFHRHQLLFIIQEALRLQTSSGLSEPTFLWPELGRFFLKASDQLTRPLVPAATKSENLGKITAALLPDFEANSCADYRNRMARSFRTMQILGRLRRSAHFIDVRAAFKDAMGISLEVYESLSVGSLAQIFKMDSRLFDPKQNAPLPFSELGLSADWFSTTSRLPSEISAFLDDISASAEDLSYRIRTENPAPNDFTALRDKPLLKDGGLFFPLDRTFLADKLESGIFWKVNNQLPQRDRLRFHSFWGEAFEEYLDDIFRAHCVGAANRFFPSPKWGNGDQLTDGLIHCGKALILMEFKGSTFTARAKYGRDENVLIEEIEVKLIGTPTAPKAVRQLAAAVNRLCRSYQVECPWGFDIRDIEVIFPLLITRDDIGGGFGINAYLQNRFTELKQSFKLLRAVKPVFCLSADNVEDIMPYFSDTSFAEILESRQKSDPKLFYPFGLAGNKVLSAKGPRERTLVSQAINEYVESAAVCLGLKDKPQASGTQ